MSSKVYFTDLRAKPGSSMLAKLERLAISAGIDTIDWKDKYVAVKIHFGEYGNMAYIRPTYAAVIVKMIKERGGKPFLTDSNTLYTGSRSNAVDHLHTAALNGFNQITTGCDVIIADGLRGTDERAVRIDGEYCPAPLIGAAIAEADIIVSLTHFKGHEQAGFGGTLKNLGMGSGSVAGKQDMHSTAQPKINDKNCIGCGICEKNCAHDAVHVEPIENPVAGSPKKKAVINYDNCVGCGECVAVCPREAAVMGSTESGRVLNCKIAEYTKAVLGGKPQFHVSFIMNVSPECDCWGHNDAAIIPDLGIAASLDPIALDQACADLVINAPALTTPNMFIDKTEKALNVTPADTKGAVSFGMGVDKFKRLHPDTTWEAALEHGEKIGLGTREYELVKVA